MSASPILDITSKEEFLAHALEMEVESIERYRELADSMDVHNNPDVADLFRQQAELSEAHVTDIRQRAQGMIVPDIPPWDFKWNCPDSPEALCLEDVNYLMNRFQALKIALHNEVRGRDFYARVAMDSPDAEVRRMAAEMEIEENEHVEQLRRWLDRESTHEEQPQEDLDPPNMPE